MVPGYVFFLIFTLVLYIYASTSEKQNSRQCVCGTCPCEAIENVLKKCHPFTKMYISTISRFSHLYYHALEFLANAYNEVSRVMECRTGCQRPIENIAPTVVPQKKKDRLIASIKTSMSSITTLSRNSLKKFKKCKEKKEDETEEAVNKSDSSSSVIASPSASDLEKSCSRCVQDGKVCISKCPKAKKKRD